METKTQKSDVPSGTTLMVYKEGMFFIYRLI